MSDKNKNAVVLHEAVANGLVNSSTQILSLLACEARIFRFLNCVMSCTLLLFTHTGVYMMIKQKNTLRAPLSAVSKKDTAAEIILHTHSASELLLERGDTDLWAAVSGQKILQKFKSRDEAARDAGGSAGKKLCASRWVYFIKVVNLASSRKRWVWVTGDAHVAIFKWGRKLLAHRRNKGNISWKWNLTHHSCDRAASRIWFIPGDI